MPEKDVVERTKALPATVDSLTSDLAKLGVARGSVLLVHVSLSSLGWVCGGPVAVIEALKQALGSAGTLVMPTHSAELSDPANWCNPPVPDHWWPIIREQMPPYDARLTPTRGMGVIAECFRTHPGALRSHHPQVSFAACGPHGATITANHSLEDGLGENSPLARLYQLQAWVLLLGVGHDRNTSLHLAEMRALGETLPRIREGAPINVNGQRQWVEFTTADADGAVFPRLGEAFANQTGLVTSGYVAAAPALLMPQPALIDFGVEWLSQHGSDS